jgi:hypothetical protein
MAKEKEFSAVIANLMKMLHRSEVNMENFEQMADKITNFGKDDDKFLLLRETAMAVATATNKDKSYEKHAFMMMALIGGDDPKGCFDALKGMVKIAAKKKISEEDSDQFEDIVNEVGDMPEDVQGRWNIAERFMKFIVMTKTSKGGYAPQPSDITSMMLEQ